METKSDVYIGRGSVFGNPYTHLEKTDNFTEYAETLMTFDNDYSQAIDKLRERSKTEDLNLVCYCKLPHKEVRCHGDIIKRLIEKDHE